MFDELISTSDQVIWSRWVTSLTTRFGGAIPVPPSVSKISPGLARPSSVMVPQMNGLNVEPGS